MKIAVYSICKDEEANIDGWAASCYDADYAVVCDTGSTDKTFEKFHNHVDYLWKITVDPWRFDTAHNVALALVPADADICIPLHLDERLTPGWRERIEEAYVANWTQEDGFRRFPNCIWYPYQFDEKTTFLQNRIHGRKGFIWRYPTHEGVYPYFGTHIVHATVKGDEPMIVQQQDLTAAHRTGRDDLTKLKFGLEENPGDSRMMFYLARQYMLEKRFNEAVPLFQNYLQGEYPNDVANLKTQRDASRYLAICFHNLGGGSLDR